MTTPLCVEEGELEEPSRAVEFAADAENLINVQVSLLDLEEYQIMEVDKRWLVDKVRAAIADRLSIDPQSFRMLNGYGGILEYKTSSGKTVKDAGISQDQKILIKTGAPTAANSTSCKFYLYTPKGAKAGLRTVPGTDEGLTEHALSELVRPSSEYSEFQSPPMLVSSKYLPV